MWPAPVGQGRPLLSGTADWEGDNAQSLPSLAPAHAAAARGRSWGKAPLEPIGTASPRHIKAELRQSSGGGGTSEPLPRAGRGPRLPAAGAGRAQAAQWKFPSPLQHERVAVPGGGAEAGSARRAAGRKGSGWDNPRAASGGAAPSPGPGGPR